MRKAAAPESKFEKYCTKANFRTHGAIWDTYTVQSENDPSRTMDVLKFKTPLDDNQLARLRILNRRIENKTDISNINDLIVRYISIDYKTSEQLKDSGVKSVMTYHDTDFVPAGNGNAYYMTTDSYMSLADPAFPSSKLTVGFVVDLGRRLFAIAKDMDNAGINHRNISPFNIYFDKKYWMVLGGFGCANIKDMNMKPVQPFLYFAHRAPDVQAGEVGSFLSDVYSIASIMKSYFLGQDVRMDPYGEMSPYVPEIIRSAIEDGLSCDPERVNDFRKKLNKAYHVGINSWWNDPLSTVTSIRIGETPSVQKTDSMAYDAPEEPYMPPTGRGVGKDSKTTETASESSEGAKKPHSMLDKIVSFAAGGVAAAMLGYVVLMFI